MIRGIIVAESAVHDWIPILGNKEPETWYKLWSELDSITGTNFVPCMITFFDVLQCVSITGFKAYEIQLHACIALPNVNVNGVLYQKCNGSSHRIN